MIHYNLAPLAAIEPLKNTTKYKNNLFLAAAILSNKKGVGFTRRELLVGRASTMVATSLLGYPFLTQAEQQTADGDDLFHQYHPITVNGIGKYSEAEVAGVMLNGWNT